MERSDASQPVAWTEVEGRRFARRLYPPRIVGLFLGCFCIGVVLWQDGAHPALWAALVFNGLLWPHLAYWIASRSAAPRRAEMRNLVVDSAFGGAWIAVMKFDLFPSALLLSMLSMDKISAGGTRLLARSATAMALACAAAAALNGFAFEPESSMLSIAAGLPLLLVYPLLVGIVTYRLSRRVRAQNQRLAEIGRTDGLSGVPNRAHWEDAVESEFQRQRRNPGSASLMMIDVDHFKSINDRYGHVAGDEVIRAVAMVLRESVRGQDMVGRYGGEEFGVVLPETGAEGAAVIAERIRQRIEGRVMVARDGIRCTVSVGIAACDPEMGDRLDWIARADRALYRAKALGRNRVAQ
jgi:diguanylate cyclase